MSLEFPPDCAWLFAALTGEVPPNGDEDKLFALAEVHKDLHGKLNNDMKQQISAALGYTSESFDGDAAAMYQAAMKSFIGEEGLNYFDAVADQAQLLATYTRKAATQLQYTKYMIIAQLVELLFEAVVAAALAFFFGASIQAYLAKCAIVRFLIRSWLGRALMTLLMHQLINVGMGVAMDLLVQWSQLNKGTRDEYEGDLTKGAALSGMIQGFLAGPFQFLGNKLGKKLADLFGKGGGKQLGKELDKAFPQPPVQGPKGPKGAGPKAPKTFGEDFAKNFANDIPHTTGPGGKAAGDRFVRNIGETFSNHLGGDKAGAVGRDWARTLLENTGKKDLPKLLDNALKPLAKEGNGALGKILGQGAADQLGRSAIRAMAQSGVHGITEGVSEGAHAAVSEGFYNLFFSDEHTFSTSGLTFGSGMVEGRVGHILEGAGDKLGGNLRNQTLEAGFKLPGGGLETPGGSTGYESGGGTGSNAGSGPGVQSGPVTASDGLSDDLSDTSSLLSTDDDGTVSSTTDNSSSVTEKLYDDEGFELLDVSGPSRDDHGNLVSDDENDGTGEGGVQPVVAAPSTMSQGTTVPSTTSANTPASTPSVSPSASASSSPTSSSSSTPSNSKPNTSSSNDQTTSSDMNSASNGPNTTSTEPTMEEQAQEQVQEEYSAAEDLHSAPQTLSQSDTQLTPAESRLAPSENANDSGESSETDESTKATAPAWTSSQAPHTVITIDTNTDVRIDMDDGNESDGAPGPSNSTPPPPHPPPPPPPNVQLSDEVRRFGTHASEGVSGVHLAPITNQVATALQRQTLTTLERLTGPLTEAQRAEALDQLAELLSPQALQDNRLMLLSRDGHVITLDVNGRPRSLAVQLQLERPRPSALFGAGSRMPPHNNEQRQAAAFDSTSTASTTAVRTISLNPFSNTFSVIKSFLTGVPTSLSFSITHQQTSLSTTVSSAVNSTSLLRSTEPASPFDYTALGRVREASTPPFQEIPPDRAGVRELGTVSAWFPEHLAVLGHGTADGNVFRQEDTVGFQAHLNDSPLWVMDSMSDPGSLLRAVRARFGGRLDGLGPGSLAAVQKYFGAEHLLGALPLQRTTDDPGGSTGTWSPVLLDKRGNAVGVFRVTAEVTRREGQDIRVGPKYSLERFLERQLKTDSLAKVSQAYSVEGGFGGVFNNKPEEADKSFRDFHLGGSVQPKGGYGVQKDKSLGAGATHGVTHNIRTNGGHVLTPANVVYSVEFIAADGTRTTPEAMLVTPVTPVRLRTLTPQTARGAVPAAGAQKQAPTEVTRLEAIGLTTTPLRVNGAGITAVLEQARGWLSDNGYLPRPGGQDGTLMDERLVKARLENLRKLSLLGSQHGLLGTMDELVDGGLVLHFGKPGLGGGVDRVRLRFTLDRDPQDTTAPTHVTSLSDVHLPSISSLSVPGTSQQSSGSSGTFQLGTQLTGFAPGHLRGALTGDYKGTWQTTDTSTAGASVSHSQMISTTQQKTEVFRVPAVFAAEITGGSGPLPPGPFTSAGQPVSVDLAVPEKRTEGFSEAYGEAVLQPAGTPLPPEQETFLLPDSSLVDVVRGSKQLYEAVDSILSDLAAPPVEEESAQQQTGPLATQSSQPSPIPGAYPQEHAAAGGSGHGPALPVSTERPSATAPANAPSSSSWWAAAAGAARSVVDSVLSMATVVRQTVSTGDRSDQGLLLHEALHAQLTPAALMSRAHQMVKGVFVIDDLFVPGVSGGTDLVVEVRAVLSNPQDLGTVRQYGETDLGVTDSASHQVTRTTSHEGGPGFTMKYGQSREEAEQAAAEPPVTDDPSAPAAPKPPTGGAGGKGVYGRGTGNSVTTSASTNMTRVPVEDGTHHRIGADITYEVTVRRGHRRVSPLNRSAASVRRTVHVPGGITFLATADQLRRGGTMLEWIAGEETGTSRPDTARLPYRFVEHGALGLAAVLEATPLAEALPAPVPEPNPALPDGSNSQEQSVAGQTAEEQETAHTDRPRPTTNEDPRRPHLLRERLTGLVEEHAPGSLTPGHPNYVPGLAQRIADYTSPAALGALPGRGAGGPLSFSFPYTGGPTTRTVTLRVHGRPAWTKEQLLLVTGRSGDQGAGVENYSAHSPANVTRSQARTTRWGFSLPGSIVVPTSGENSRKATFSPSAGGSTTRSDNVSTTFTAEDRLWQRVEGGNEFTLGYVFTADLHIEGESVTRPSVDVPGRVTLRFSGDHARQQAPAPLPERERLDYVVATEDPALFGPLATATPLRPTGNEVAYALSNQQDLLLAVQELAPELAGEGLGSGSSSEGAAVRLTELLHGGTITMDPVRAAAGAGGTVTGTAKHPRVTLSTRVFRPRLIDTARNVTVDRVRVTGFSTTSGSSTSRSSSFTLGVSGTLGSKGGFDFGGSVPLLTNQSTPGGQGGGVSALARHWEKTGTAGMPGADQGLRTYEVEVDTVTTLTGPTGELRYATGTALLRVSERDLLGLGVLPEGHRGEAVWDLSAPDVRELAPAQVAQLISASGDVLPPGAVVQLWLDLGPDPTPAARVEALYRAQSVASESGQTLELALRDGDGTRVWTLVPDSTVFPDRNGAQARLDAARERLRLFEEEHGRPPSPAPDPREALRQATALRAAAALDRQRARQVYADQQHLVTGLDRTRQEAGKALLDATRMLESTRERLTAAAPGRGDALARRETMLLDAVAELEQAVTAYEDLDAAARSLGEADAVLERAARAEDTARLEHQWHEARQAVERANARHIETGVELLALGAGIARAHRTGGTGVPGLLLPPLSDPTAQSLASLTPQWPAPRAPGEGTTPPATAANSVRRMGERTENPVLPHEVAAFHETTTAAVHTERFDPKRVQSRREAGRLDGSLTLIRSHVRRMRMPDGRTVRQFFVTLPVRLTDGLGAQDLAALRARLQATLDAHVNTGYTLPDSGDQLHVTVEFVESAGHSEAVTLSQSDGPPVRADQRRWDVGHSDAVLTHEILHYLGLADEYSDAGERPQDRHLFRRDDLASGVHREGLMVSTAQESLENLPHDYLATIERVSENAVVPLHTAIDRTTRESLNENAGKNEDAGKTSERNDPEQEALRQFRVAELAALTARRELDLRRAEQNESLRISAAAKARARIADDHGDGPFGDAPFAPGNESDRASSSASDHASDLMAMDLDEPETASQPVPQATPMDLDEPAPVEVVESEPTHPGQEWSVPAPGNRPQTSTLTYVNQAFSDLVPPASLHDLTESEYQDWLQNSLPDDPDRSGQAFPVSYVVNAIVSERELREHPERLQEFLDAVTEELEGYPGRVAVVVGVNARVEGPPGGGRQTKAAKAESTAAKHAEIAATVRHAAAQATFARPLALVPMTMTWPDGKAFPFGTARNNVLESNANRHLVRSMMDRRTHPYIAFMDFDTYPHVVSTRDGATTRNTHVFSWFESRLETGEDALPLRPLMMSGGYRLPRPDETAATARLKELTESRYAALLAEKGRPATSSFEEMLETVRSEITHDMRVRTRLRGLHPLLPYSPEPNLFVDAAATLLRGAPDRHQLRFGPGGAEFHNLSQSLNRVNTWELREDLPLPRPPAPHADFTTHLRRRWAYAQRLEAQHTRRKVAAENQVLPRRGAAFVVEFEQAAVLTDLSRLVAGRWATGALPQDHVGLTNPFQRMFHQSEPGLGNVQAGRRGLQLAPFRDIWGLAEYQDEEVLDSVSQVPGMKGQPLWGSATQPVHTNSPLWPVHPTTPLVHGAPVADRAPGLAAHLDPRLGVPGVNSVSVSISDKVSREPDPVIWAGIDPNNIRLFSRALALSADNPYFLDHLRYFAHEYLPSFRDGHVPAGQLVPPLGSQGTLFRALDSVPHGEPGGESVLQAVWRGLYADTNSLQAVGTLVAEADRHGIGVEELFTRLATGSLHSPGQSFTELRHGQEFTLGPDAHFLLGQYASALGMSIEVRGLNGEPYATQSPGSSVSRRLVIEWHVQGPRGERGWSAYIEQLPETGSKRPGGGNHHNGRMPPKLRTGATGISSMMAGTGLGGGAGRAT
ncbi:hypothetical protein P8A22_07460 [Streptomyces laculatispora]|uniref:Outer membrane channel protein CpnT-like N-terminal domain-containing protein n=1 Tax=Streptomyces laculatispora TaxID=887464 RepID=A0ABY9HZ35_9ACTN|nr:hypothetical protein [Streptomyces laculatispora]WLQ39863.1 hypothetical protein P8A22_07460 [Streptomyces laculatispora]